MFHFRLDSSSGVPPYLQLVHQVQQAVLLGFLQPGDRLPLIREVVEFLAINPNTVARSPVLSVLPRASRYCSAASSCAPNWRSRSARTAGNR